MLSVVILAKNAASTLSQTLDSVKWADEILVIDDNSIDQTKEIATKAGAVVLTHALENDFAQQRNFALEKAKNDWVLFVDADEVVSSSLREEVVSKIKNQETHGVGYFVQRIDYMWGKKLLHGEFQDIWLLRLAKKNAGKWQGKVHETWHVKGKTERLQQPLFHYPHPTISEFLQEINFYTTLRAEELHGQHISVTWVDIILYPKAKFIVNYFLKLGFLDGLAGFITALLMSFHSFLVRAKLWQRNHNS